MKIINIDIQKPDNKIIEKAAFLIKNGGVIVYPTDTCYGLGADFKNQKAIEKIAKIKNRPKEKKFSVIVADLKMAKKYCEINPDQEKILKKYLPGPYTFILKLKNGGSTLGIRIPKYLFTQKLVEKFGAPFISTSANLSGKNPCYEVDCVLKQFKDSSILPDLIIDAGKLPKNPPSRVVDLTKKISRVLRGESENIVSSIKYFRRHSA